jgi:magnesium chelatase subunit I
VEFVLEGLHLTRRLAKDVLDDGRVVYGSAAAPDDGPHDPDDRRRRRRDR